MDDQLELDEYDLGIQDVLEPTNNQSAPNAYTQVDENLGVQDLGVEDLPERQAPKRVIPKLDSKKLLDDKKGYNRLFKQLQKVKYRGKGTEKDYLKKYVMSYQMWANSLWPKANFDDFVLLERSVGKDPLVRNYKQQMIQSEKLKLRRANEPQPDRSQRPTKSNHAADGAGNHSNEDNRVEHTSDDNGPEQAGQTEQTEQTGIDDEQAFREAEMANNSDDESQEFPDPAEFEMEGPTADEEAAANSIYAEMGF